MEETEWDFEVGLWGLRSDVCSVNASSHCVPFVFGYEYFFTRYPRETTKFWNIIYLFTPESWMWTFISIPTIIFSLYLARTLSVKIGLSGDSTEEIVLIPFRFFL